MSILDLRHKRFVLNCSGMRQLTQRFLQLQPVYQLSIVGAVVAIALHLLAWFIFSNLDFNIQYKAIESKPVAVILPALTPVHTPLSPTHPAKQIASPVAIEPEKVQVQSDTKPTSKPAIGKGLPLKPNRTVSPINTSKAQTLKALDGPLQTSSKTVVPPPPATAHHTEVITFTAPFEISGATVSEQSSTTVAKTSQASAPRVVAGWQQRQILYAIAARNKAARKRPLDISEVAPVSNNSPIK
jgi:hypothetical protein